MNVTAADVQRVARTYFNETNRVVLHILPEGRRIAMNCADSRRSVSCGSWVSLVCARVRWRQRRSAGAANLADSSGRRGRCRRAR